MRRIAMPDEGIETLFGSLDDNLRALESALGVRLRTSGHHVLAEGDAEGVERAERVLGRLGDLLRSGYRFGRDDVKVAAQLVATDPDVALEDYFLKASVRTAGKRQVTPKTPTQRRYLEAIDSSDLVFGVGPAGTGKTYLAMAQAVSALLAKRVSRILLARPAVERGMKYGSSNGSSASSRSSPVEEMPAACVIVASRAPRVRRS